MDGVMCLEVMMVITMKLPLMMLITLSLELINWGREKNKNITVMEIV